MKNPKRYLYLDESENSLVLKSLMNMRNRLIAEGRYHDIVDDVILKVINAPRKKIRVR